MPPLSVMMKPASGMCNMRCDYCFYCDETSKRSQEHYGFMSIETLKNVIRKTMSQAEGSITYAFQGGEPSLRGIDFFRQAVAFQKQYNHKRLPVMNGFQTNGLLIDEEWCRFFKKNNFLVGVSLDGTKAVHDACRHTKAGDDTYGRVTRSIRLLEQYEVDFNILTVVTAQAVEHIEEIYRYYDSQGWRYQQYIACLDPLDESHGAKPYALTPEQYGQFLIRLFDLWYADWEKGRQPYIRQFENFVAILLGRIPEACDQRGVCSCQTVVEADGSVYPCDFYMLDAYRLGNLNTQRFSQLSKAEAFLERSTKLTESCRACRYFSICRGGCQRSRDPVGNGLYENYLCEGYKMFFDSCLERLQFVAQTIKKPSR